MVSGDRNRYVGDWDQDNHRWDFTFWWRKTGNKEEEGKGEEEEGEKEKRKRDILVGGLVSGRSEIGLTFFVYEESYEKIILILSEHRKHP